MFTNIPDDKLVGTQRLFMPQGYSPYQISGISRGENWVLCNGDMVTVESAWTRDYLPPTDPNLYYVRSHRTGLATHVTFDEIKLALPFPTESAAQDRIALERETSYWESVIKRVQGER